MRKLHEKGYDLADWLIVGLTKIGYQLNDGDAVLDFGCGAGGLVYRFRELGYDAYGFDIHNYLALRKAEDAQFFRFLKNPITDTSDASFEPGSYQIPFETNRFDFIVSTSTLEHVADLAPVMAEISRVLKPNGVALHLYPVKSFLFEPHIYVPLGGMIQKEWWFHLWALLGVRNPFQKNMPVDKVVESNMRFCRTGLHYWTIDELYAASARHFDHVEFARELFHASVSPMKTDLRNVWRALCGGNAIADLAALPKLHCLLTTKKRMTGEAQALE